MKCANNDCNRVATSLQCPICLNSGNSGPETFFCNQNCFKSAWPMHKLTHTPSAPIYNPYPYFKYTGKLRPSPLSPPQILPANIQRPDYAETGIPKSEYETRKVAIVQPLLSETIQKMRTVCKVNIYFLL